MTNKQLQALKNLRDQINSELCDSFYETSQEGREALDVAIKALEQEPTDDATLKDIFCMGCEYKEQEPKTGHWVDHPEGKWIYAQCSECGRVHDAPFSYCPSCGAKMESEGKE